MVPGTKRGIGAKGAKLTYPLVCNATSKLLTNKMLVPRQKGDGLSPPQKKYATEGHILEITALVGFTAY